MPCLSHVHYPTMACPKLSARAFSLSSSTPPYPPTHPPSGSPACYSDACTLRVQKERRRRTRIGGTRGSRSGAMEAIESAECSAEPSISGEGITRVSICMTSRERPIWKTGTHLLNPVRWRGVQQCVGALRLPLSSASIQSASTYISLDTYIITLPPVYKEFFPSYYFLLPRYFTVVRQASPSLYPSVPASSRPNNASSPHNALRFEGTITRIIS